MNTLASTTLSEDFIKSTDELLYNAYLYDSKSMIGLISFTILTCVFTLFGGRLLENLWDDDFDDIVEYAKPIIGLASGPLHGVINTWNFLPIVESLEAFGKIGMNYNEKYGNGDEDDYDDYEDYEEDANDIKVEIDIEDVDAELGDEDLDQDVTTPIPNN